MLVHNKLDDLHCCNEDARIIVSNRDILMVAHHKDMVERFSPGLKLNMNMSSKSHVIKKRLLEKNNINV